MKIKKICEHCGKEFYADQRTTLFCSKECNVNSMNRHIGFRTIIESFKKEMCSKYVDDKITDKVVYDHCKAIKYGKNTNHTEKARFNFLSKLTSKIEQKKRIYKNNSAFWYLPKKDVILCYEKLSKKDKRECRSFYGRLLNTGRFHLTSDFLKNL